MTIQTKAYLITAISTNAYASGAMLYAGHIGIGYMFMSIAAASMLTMLIKRVV